MYFVTYYVCVYVCIIVLKKVLKRSIQLPLLYVYLILLRRGFSPTLRNIHGC